MGFMQHEVTHKEKWFEIDGPNGTEFYPAEDFSKEEAKQHYGNHYSARTIHGYGARLSAPGYMDATEWSVFTSLKAAQDYLNEYYPNEED